MGNTLTMYPINAVYFWAVSMHEMNEGVIERSAHTTLK
jgi:hypothetical protein